MWSLWKERPLWSLVVHAVLVALVVKRSLRSSRSLFMQLCSYLLVKLLAKKCIIDQAEKERILGKLQD